MPMLNVERDTEILIDNQLRNLGWRNDPHATNRNVYQQRVKTTEQRKQLQGGKPDYILYPSNSSSPLAIIEAKRQGRNIHDALIQGIGYADKLDAPIVFATDGVFTKTAHTKLGKPLILNGEEVDELIREQLALKYLVTNEISTLGKKVIKSRAELISIFPDYVQFSFFMTAFIPQPDSNPIIIRKRPPRGVCDDCWGQGQYMVLRPGMFVPCDECNPVSEQETTTLGTGSTE